MTTVVAVRDAGTPIVLRRAAKDVGASVNA
jgi:hypothetical protein